MAECGRAPCTEAAKALAKTVLQLAQNALIQHAGAAAVMAACNLFGITLNPTYVDIAVRSSVEREFCVIHGA